MTHAETRAKEVMILEDQEQGQAGHGQQVLAEQEVAGAIGQEAIHQRIDFLAARIEELHGQHCVDEGSADHGQHADEHGGREAVDEIGPPMFVGTAVLPATAGPGKRPPRAGGLLAAVGHVSPFSRRRSGR